MTFGTVAILGPGLIGGSLALALAERCPKDKLVIYARKNATFPAIKAKLPQAELTTDVVAAVRNADVVVLCVPVETMASLVKEFRDVLKKTALVTDVGSVKGSVDRDLEPLLKDRAHWIGSHPMAGSEKSGFSAARANLFDDALVIVTPQEIKTTEALTKAVAFWKVIALRGRIECIEPEFHDLVIAEISHLPHLLAAVHFYKMTDEARALAESKLPYTMDQALALAGSGFKDVTRIASGSPDLWTEILLENRAAVVMHLHAFAIVLNNVAGLLQDNNRSALFELLKDAQNARSQLLEKKSA